MCRRVSLQSSLRIVLVLFIGVALLPAPCVSMLVSAMGQGRGPRTIPPRPGKPEGTFPDLDGVKNESSIEREPPAPIPSTIRSQRNTGKPWDGRRVGDPEPPRGGLHAHARRMRLRPLLIEDQFIQNFFTVALVRSATYEETLYWNYQMRAAYNDSVASLKLSAIELGRTVFESAAYAARQRDAHGYVQDLYRTYLMREPDSTGWANWEATVGSNGREYVRRGFEESTEFATLLANITPSGPPSATASSLIAARVDPRNQPGNGMLARDAAWSVPLLSLPGRNGLDLGLALSYSSMVWTRSGPYIYFDEDNDFPSPGFRLGFPTVQHKLFDAQTGKQSYLLITAAGERVELRQVGTSNIYDAGDSSYLRLTDNGSTLLVHSTDGTKLSFWDINGEYRCVEIKDRNGNYITVNNNALGRISSIVDTLGRVINFNYDSNANLLSITQAWNGQPAHPWVTFAWSTRTMQSSFSGAAVVGTANGATLPVIIQVGLNDTSRFTFDYTNSLQVSVIRNYFDTERNATSFTYDTPGGDAPRLISSSVSAQNWTGLNGVPAQVTTQYSVGADGSCTLTAPDGTIYKEYYGTGWQRGLTTLSEVWAAGVRQKWTTTAWTQDNTAAGYEVNPRVTETNVYDAGGNRRRTVIDYGAYAAYGLPYAVHEYAADGSTELRQTFTDYNLSQAYLDRRIIGLVSQVRVADGAQSLTKITYDYDDPARLHGVPAAATQHDGNYNLALTARGNVTAVSRWDVDDINNAVKKLTSYTDYYNTGSLISTTDAAGHQSSLTYGDSFSDNGMRNTFAYPTTITDAGNFSSYIQYNFDFGATTRTQSPAPAAQAQGAIQTMSYNNLGQLERITTTNNGAYKRFWYGANYTASYATVNNVVDEAYAIQVEDGVGRVIGAVSNHPGSTGGYSLVNTIYDQMGRAAKVSNPTEVNSSWLPKGDDDAGIYYTQQTYDWKGRPRITTNPDGTTKDVSYTGCGCAGGEVATYLDEGTMVAGVAKRRKQKVYSDVLGRPVKTEIFIWQDGGIDSTTVQTYNPRDQLTQIRQYSGSETSGTFQDTAITYDGFGRLKTKHVPEQTVGTVTTWSYNADDTVLKVTDARGASKTFGYNTRHLPTSITYAVPNGSTITVPAPVSFIYDGAGNRTKMTDGNGQTDYVYDQLSRLTSEKRSFTGLTGTFSIGYGYNLGNQLTSIAEPTQFGSTFSYVHDAVGRLTNVNGSPFDGVTSYASNAQYRAWGSLKHLNYGNGKALDVTYNNRLQTATFAISGVMSKSYQYYADGSLRFSGETTSHTWDRFYSYDHNGRVKEAFSGAEARFEGLTNSRPYRQTFTYDGMGHLSGETSKIWSASFTRSDTFTNNRRNGWAYDADGSLRAGDNTYTYDAGGEVQIIDQNNAAGTTERFLDGDGQQVKTNNSVFNQQIWLWVTTTTYYLHSTLLGGQVLTEIDSSGAKQRTFMFANGSIIAWQKLSGSTQSLIFEHRDAGNASFRTTDVQGFSGTEPDEIPAELDPTGANTIVQPAPEPPQGENETLVSYPTFADPRDPGTTYSIDGIRVPADYFARFVNFAFHGPFGLAEAALRASARVQGRRVTGVHWGTAFEAIYDENGNLVSVKWGKFDPNQSDVNFGKETLLYNSWNLNLLPQNSVVEDDRPQLQGDNNGDDCGIVVNFKPGTTNPVSGLPNGPSTINYRGQPNFGFGFSITGWVGSGGIGTIGIDPNTGRKVSNPNNPNGRWSLEQWTHSWIGGTGTTTIEKKTFPDLPLDEAGLKADGDSFGFYDHPGGPPPTSGFSRFENHLIKVYSGKTVCDVKFHFIQRGNTIHWGPGLL